MDEPIARVRFDDIDEIGIYLKDNRLRFVYYDEQTNTCVFECPVEFALPLGDVLTKIGKAESVK